MRRRSLKALSVLVPGVVLGLAALPTLTGVANSASVPASFSFSGSGWGHGVGMSQVGARGQAAEGRTADQILRHYYTGSKVAAYRDDQNVRVNLAYQVASTRLRVEALSSGAVAVELTAGGRSIKAGPKDVIELRPSGSSVVARKNGAVAISGGRVSVKWSGTRYPGSTGRNAAVVNLVKGNDSFTTSGHRYRYGSIEAVARTSSGRTTLSVTNLVRLHDEYVLGIGEMPSSWPAAALQAQVIASRGYAMVKYRQGIRSGCDCHVFGSTADQVFVGWAKQAGTAGSRWTAAVRATNVSAITSKTVLVNGVPAQTFFFSSSGGRTQNSEDVWVSKLSYLRSVDDRWSKNSSLNSNAAWGPRVRSQADVAKAFGLPNVVRLDLSTRYASGAVRTATAWSSTGRSASVAGPTLMNRLAMTSRWFWPTGFASGATPDPNRFLVTASAPTASEDSVAVIKGRVVPASSAAGHLVSLKQWDAVKGTWLYLGAAKVRSDGSYSLPFKPTRKGTFKYTVHKPAESCGAKCVKGSSSARISVKVGPRFWIAPTVKAKTTSSASVPVSGVVSPASAAKGQKVKVMRYYSSSKKWVSVATPVVSSSGSFRAVLRPLPKGTTTLRVDKAGAGCTASGCVVGAGTSKTFSVRVS